MADKQTKSELKNEVALALIRQSVDYIKDDVRDIKKKMDDNFVTRGEFDPIKRIVYGLVTLILIAVVGAMIAQVVIQTK